MYFDAVNFRKYKVFVCYNDDELFYAEVVINCSVWFWFTCVAFSCLALRVTRSCICRIFQQHKKVLDKYGKPEDALPGIKSVKEPLPHFPLTGMYNKAGGKVRLTFKLELDQLWLGTKGMFMSAFFNNICRCVGITSLIICLSIRLFVLAYFSHFLEYDISIKIIWPP